MELRHLRYFLTTAELRSFRKAAERLHISQPPLSKQVRQLEEELQVTLIDRSKKQIDLTVAGRVFAECAKRILSDAEKSKDLALRAEKGEVGQLHLGTSTSHGCALFGIIIKEFSERFPQVDLKLHTLNAPELISGIKDGRIDVAFPIVDAPNTLPDHLAILPVCEEQVVLALPTNHPLANMRVLPLSSLCEYPQLIGPRTVDPSWCEFISDLYRPLGRTPDIVEVADDYYAICMLIAAGRGISIMTRYFAESLNIPGVTLRAFAPGVAARLAVMYDGSKESSTRNNFLKLLRELREISNSHRDVSKFVQGSSTEHFAPHPI